MVVDDTYNHSNYCEEKRNQISGPGIFSDVKTVDDSFSFYFKNEERSLLFAKPFCFFKKESFAKKGMENQNVQLCQNSKHLLNEGQLYSKPNPAQVIRRQNFLGDNISKPNELELSNSGILVGIASEEDPNVFQALPPLTAENTASTCLDGIDNDGDGLIDAIDPDCFSSNNTPTLDCITDALLVQTASSVWSNVDLVTGNYVTHSDNITTGLNAAGYNIKDSRIWGYDQNVNDGRIFVATQNTDLTWQVTMSPVIDSLVGGNFNCGDVDSLGVLYLLSGSTGTRKIFRIDVNPLSPTYLTIIFKKLIVIPSSDNFSDWGFNPRDGKLYAVSNRKHALTFDLTTTPVTLIDLGVSGIPASESSSYGAVYFDKDGFCYAANNTSGNIYRLDFRTTSGSDYDETKTAYFTHGPPSSINDGARCVSNSVLIDFGDAPSSYGTLLNDDGARHSITHYSSLSEVADLYLGSSIKSEFDGQPSSDASLSSDDNGVVSLPNLSNTDEHTQTIGSYSTTVSYVNNTGKPAHFGAWIDWNNNGKFDSTEAKLFTTAGNLTSGTVTFTWSNVILTGGAGLSHTFIRFRVSTDTMYKTSMKGPLKGGEVEDYQIAFSVPLPVKLISFTGARKDNIADLQWITTDEVDMAYYQLEVAYNEPEQFRSIYLQNAKNNLNQKYGYNYLLAQPGVYYFRLKIVGKDGSIQFSKIITITFQAKEIDIFPNPANDFINIKLEQTDKYDIEIFDLFGRSIKRLKCNNESQLEVDVSNLVPGSYLMRVQNGGNIDNLKFIKL